MSLSLVRYPLDPTGVNPNNHITGEVRSLSAAQVRSVVPLYGPVFAESLVVHDNGICGNIVSGENQGLNPRDSNAKKCHGVVCAIEPGGESQNSPDAECESLQSLSDQRQVTLERIRTKVNRIDGDSTGLVSVYESYHAPVYEWNSLRVIENLVRIYERVLELEPL